MPIANPYAQYYYPHGYNYNEGAYERGIQNQTDSNRPNSSGGSGGLTRFLGGLGDRFAGLGQLAQAQAPMDVVNQLGQSQSYFQNLYAPDIANLNQQNSLLNSQLTAQNAYYQSQSGILPQLYNVAVQQLQAQGGIAAIDEAAIARQMELLATQQGLLGQHYNSQQGTLGTMQSLADQAYQAQLSALNVNKTQQNLAATQATDLETSNAIARGAAATPGHQRDVGYIASQLANELQLLQIREQEAGIGYEGQKAQFKQQADDLLFDFNMSNLGINEQRAKLEDRRGALAKEAEIRGLRERELALQLQQGLAQLNLSNVMSVGQIMDGINSNNRQQQQIAQAMINAAIGTAGAFGGSSRSTSRPSTATYRSPQLIANDRNPSSTYRGGR